MGFADPKLLVLQSILSHGSMFLRTAVGMQQRPLWKLAIKVHHNLAGNTGGFLACRRFKISKRCETVLRQAHTRRVRVRMQFNTGHEAYAHHGKGHELAGK